MECCVVRALLTPNWVLGQRIMPLGAGGQTYYRLKMVDANGSFTYSKTVSVRSESQKGSVRIYPNPTKSFLTIDIQGVDNQNITMEITDALGRIYRAQTIQTDQSTIPTTDLPNGIYFLKIKRGERVEVLKFLKE